MKKQMKKYLLPVLGCVAMLGFFSGIPEASASPQGKCKMCHDFGSANKTGPGLKGIIGRKMGSVEGFSYGSYLKAQNAAGATWNPENLRAWIADSKGVAKAAGGKTKMPKQRVKGKKADAIITFLKGLK